MAVVLLDALRDGCSARCCQLLFPIWCTGLDLEWKCDTMACAPVRLGVVVPDAVLVYPQLVFFVIA